MFQASVYKDIINVAYLFMADKNYSRAQRFHINLHDILGNFLAPKIVKNIMEWMINLTSKGSISTSSTTSEISKELAGSMDCYGKCARPIRAKPWINGAKYK